MQYSVLFLHGKLITTYWNHFLYTLNLCGVVNTSFPWCVVGSKKISSSCRLMIKKKVDIEDTNSGERERERERERPWEDQRVVVWRTLVCIYARMRPRAVDLAVWGDIYMFREALSPLSGIPASYARKDLAIPTIHLSPYGGCTRANPQVVVAQIRWSVYIGTCHSCLLRG